MYRLSLRPLLLVRRTVTAALLLLVTSACVDDELTGPRTPTRGAPPGTAQQVSGSGFLYVEYPGAEFTDIYDMNESGQVVGRAYLEDPIGHFRGFVWYFGTLTPAPGPAYAINDGGAITGTAGGVAFRWSNGVVEYSTAGPEGRNINDRGDVVIGNPDGGPAYLWTTDGALVNLGLLPGQTRNVPLKINNARQIIGQSGTRGFLWQNGSMQDLGTLGGASAGPVDLNHAGQVVGESALGNGAFHAFLWTPDGGMQDLGTLGGANSSANAVNAGGQVVGWSETASGERHAFRWTAGRGMEDLGTLPTFPNSQARDINDAGVVSGFSYVGSIYGPGIPYGFVWTPANGLDPLGLGPGTQINNNNHVFGYDQFWYDVVTRTGPTVDAGGPYRGRQGKAILFDGARTTNPDGEALAYAWDFTGDGTPDAAGMHAGFTFSAPGTYTVRLYVTDAAGVTRTDDASVTIGAPRWPQAVIAPPPGGQYAVAEGGRILLSSQGSAAENGGRLLYRWEFGDGTFAQSRFQDTPFAWSKVYGDNGTYTARLIVWDPALRSDTTTVQVVVRNTLPWGTFLTGSSILESSDFPLGVTSATDSAAPDRHAGFTYAFDCGRGGGYGPFAAAATATCRAPVDDASYGVGARIRDKDGGVREYRRTITAGNARPRITAVTRSGSVFIVGIADPGTNDAPWRWVVGWGDGTRSDGTVPEQGPGAVLAPHTYAAGGPYTAIVYVYDKEGSASKITSVTITP